MWPPNYKRVGHINDKTQDSDGQTRLESVAGTGSQVPLVWNLNFIVEAITPLVIIPTTPVFKLHEFSSIVPNNISIEDNISAQQC